MKGRLLRIAIIILLSMTFAATLACEAPAPSALPKAEFEVVSLDIEPTEVIPGEATKITVEVRNSGGREGIYVAILTVDGTAVETKEIMIAAGVTQAIDFSLAKDTPGTYEITIDELSSTFIVKGKLTLEELACQIHRDAWSKLVSQAENNAYLKYAIYAYRTLAVKHPEVYLQGDNILSEVLTTNAGFKRAYEIKDVHSEYLFKQRELTGPPFSFEDVDFGKYKLVNCQDLYPLDYPFLPFIDRRLDLLTTTLKTFDDRVTQLEKAEQLYFAEKKRGSGQLYLIYCDNENAYLYRDGYLISSADREKVDNPQGNPILIFNEHNVWYPLMNRDDTGRSEVLNELVTKYSTSVKEPELSDFERGLVSRLKAVTEFTDARNLTFLKVACINASQTMPYLLPQEIKRELGQLHLTWFVWCERALNEKMNLPSPISAYLAAIVKYGQDKDEIRALCDEYGYHTRTPGHRESHGHVWRCSMLEYGVEHAYRTRAGHCVVQAAAIGTALELAGVDSYRLQGFATSDGQVMGHDFIYVPEHDLIISNGHLGTYFGNVTGGTVVDRCRIGEFKYVDFVEHDGRWAYLWRMYTCSPFYGTLSPKETIEILDYLRSIHDDDIQGRRWEAHKLIKIPYEQLKQQLIKEQEHWQPYEILPYGIP